MQRLQDFLHRSEYARLVVRDGVFIAKGPGDYLGFLQLVARHVGKQVMLDLVVEAPIPEIDERVGPYIPSG